MKKMKKLVSMMLTLVMVLAMAVPAFADGPEYTITITNTNSSVSIAENTYTAYRLFEETTENRVNSDGTTTEVPVYTYNPQTCLPVEYEGKSGITLIELLGTYENDSSEIRKFADYVYTTYVQNPTEITNDMWKAATADGETAVINVEMAGYYLVFGAGKNINGATGEEEITAAVALTTAMPKETIKPKLSGPSLDKQIKHNEITDEARQWGAIGDNQIGDEVNFRIITTVPNTNGYDSQKYIYKIYDTMEPGLTFDADSVKIEVKKKNGSKSILSPDFYTLTTTDVNPYTFTIDVKIIDAVAVDKMAEGDELYITYNAVLNQNAYIYDDNSNNNTAHLQYSNNPYDVASTGETPVIEVYDWTFKMVVQKIDGATKESLNGAQFVLSESPITFNYNDKNDDGSVKIPENISLIKFIKGSDGNYIVVGDTVTEGTTTTIEAGDIVIKGLDDATPYYLYEIKAPAGYNLKEGTTTFEINAEYSSDNHKDIPTVTVEVDGKTSTEAAVKIENNQGVQLPSTGGIGTTIFYILGGILVAGAGILLITKKRMSNTEN